MFNIISQGIYDEAQYQQHELGTLGMDKWGNKFRYVKNGAATLVVGELLQEPAEDTNFRSMVCAASQVIGDQQITVTLAGTAVTANQFDEGIIYIESATGIGQQFRIVRHSVQTSTTGACTFYLDRPLKVAITVTTTQVTVRKNPYKGVIEYPITTQTGGAVGVALYAMTAAYFGWIQSGGDCAVLWDTGTNSSNGVSGVGPSSAVAGSVKPQTGAEGGIVIGFSREVVSVDSTMGLVHLTID
jgi:hypothetical protein